MVLWYTSWKATSPPLKELGNCSTPEFLCCQTHYCHILWARRDPGPLCSSSVTKGSSGTPRTAHVRVTAFLSRIHISLQGKLSRYSDPHATVCPKATGFYVAHMVIESCVQGLSAWYSLSLIALVDSRNASLTLMSTGIAWRSYYNAESDSVGPLVGPQCLSSETDVSALQTTFCIARR